MAESGTPRRPPESRREWLTVPEVAVRLRVSDCTARRRMRTTSLMAKFSGGATGYRIRRAELRSFLRG
jgi:excisionase family DNA binding protein